MVIRGTVENGHVVPSRPLGLPEGSPVLIVPVTTPAPERRTTALKRVRERAVDQSLPDDAFSTDHLYED